MHSLQALALMQEKRMAARIAVDPDQRSPSSTDWPGSNGTAKVSQWPAARSTPRQIFRIAVSLIGRRARGRAVCSTRQDARRSSVRPG